MYFETSPCTTKHHVVERINQNALHNFFVARRRSTNEDAMSKPQMIKSPDGMRKEKVKHTHLHVLLKQFIVVHKSYNRTYPIIPVLRVKHVVKSVI